MVYLETFLMIFLAFPLSGGISLVCRYLSTSDIRLESGTSSKEYNSSIIKLRDTRVSCMTILMNPVIVEVAYLTIDMP